MATAVAVVASALVQLWLQPLCLAESDAAPSFSASFNVEPVGVGL